MLHPLWLGVAHFLISSIATKAKADAAPEADLLDFALHPAQEFERFRVKFFDIYSSEERKKFVEQGRKRMTFLCISDTHTLHYGFQERQLPPTDVLIHAGDFANRCKDMSDPVDFNAWLATLPHCHKIVIAGNQEYAFNKMERKDIQSQVLTNCTYLEDSTTTLANGHINVYGTPWNTSRNMAFSCARANIGSKYEAIPLGTDILISHMPPKQILDLAGNGRHWGSEALFDRVTVVKPRVHIFGHVHEQYGGGRLKNSTLKTFFINAASKPCERLSGARMLRDPIVFDYFV
jgi:Icc-related predicted phosphoesterase